MGWNVEGAPGRGQGRAPRALAFDRTPVILSASEGSSLTAVDVRGTCSHGSGSRHGPSPLDPDRRHSCRCLAAQAAEELMTFAMIGTDAAVRNFRHYSGGPRPQRDARQGADFSMVVGTSGPHCDCPKVGAAVAGSGRLRRNG